MKKLTNRTYVEGYVYENKLDLKVTGPTSKNPGTEYINGTLRIATDEDCMNIVDVHFSYTTATTSKGTPNATFTMLKNIIDGKIGTVMSDGKDNAGKVRIDTAIGLNEFPDKQNEGEIIAAKRNEGGFIHAVSSLNDNEKQRATFECDMVITNCVRKEADEERNIPEKVTIKGAIFDFRGALLPVEFTALNAGAMDYFEGLGATSAHPVFTKVKGQQVSQTIVKTIEEESAFGEASVREVTSTHKDFVVTWAQAEPYEWDSEETMLASEFKSAIEDRRIHVAEIIQKQKEWEASKNTVQTKPAASTAVYEF